MNARNAYNLLADGGCVTAGGPYPGYGQSLSDMAHGGKNQVDAGSISTPPPTPPPTFASCSSSQKALTVEIVTDNFPDETTWTITEKCSENNEVIMSGGPYSSTDTEYYEHMCVDDRKYEFKIIVSIFFNHSFSHQFKIEAFEFADINFVPLIISILYHARMLMEMEFAAIGVQDPTK